MSSLRIFLMATLSASVIAANNSAAVAGGFALREQSAYGQGSSFAGVAAGGSLSTMFWNPATLAQIMGLEIEVGASGVIPITEVLATYPFFGTVDEGDIGQDAFVPNAYGAYRINDRIIIGLGVNGPFGLSTQYPAGSPARIAGIAGDSDIFTINVNPAVAVQINDYLAVALGAQIQWLDLKLTDQATLLAGIVDLEADGYGYGLTAGVFITPGPNTEIGIGYRSRIDNDVDGTLTTPQVPLPASATLKLPDVVTIGVHQQINDYWSVMGGVEWSNWSRFDTVTLVTAFGSETLTFNYDDGWFFSLGAERMINENVTLRGGVGWEISPISDAVRTFRLPDDDRLWLSIGGSVQASENFSFDFGYSFLTTFDTTINNTNPANGGGFLPAFATAQVDANVHIFSASAKIKFGGPKAPAAQEPTVRKY